MPDPVLPIPTFHARTFSTWPKRFVDLLAWASAAQRVHVDPNDASITFLLMAADIRARASRVLADELVARLATTDRDHSARVHPPWAPDGFPTHPAFMIVHTDNLYGFDGRASWFARRSPARHHVWTSSTPQTPGSSEFYVGSQLTAHTECDSIEADLAELDAKNQAIDGALAAQASQDVTDARATYLADLQARFPSAGFV